MILKIYLLIFYPTVVVCMFDHNNEVSYHWSETYQTNLSSWNVLCLIRFPKLVFKFCSKQWIQLRYWLLSLNRSEGILSMDGLLWPMVSFLSFRQSTEPVLISYVSRQDSGSSLLPESVSDSSSDPCHLLQWSLNEFICWPFFFRFHIPFVILW